jgi:hypothetical protein
MASKDLLLDVDATEAALIGIELAIDLAHRHSSRVAALYARELSDAQLHGRATAELGLTPTEQIHRLSESQEASINRTAARMQMASEGLAQAHGVKVELRSIDGLAALTVPQRTLRRPLPSRGTRQHLIDFPPVPRLAIASVSVGTLVKTSRAARGALAGSIAWCHRRQPDEVLGLGGASIATRRQVIPRS